MAAAVKMAVFFNLTFSAKMSVKNVKEPKNVDFNDWMLLSPHVAKNNIVMSGAETCENSFLRSHLK